jgi:DNA (cytosine-5)-methyltransferase 1
MNHLDLFSGIGGFSLGLEATQQIKTVAFCEIDKFCTKVLNKNWPTVPVYNDIKELTYDKLKEDGIGPIDIITGGYPCQPFSQAGRKKGEEDSRHLWPEYFRLIKECRPSFIIGENVSGHIKLGIDTVLKDLESEGYVVRAFSISAASIGANHKRERVWIVAHTRQPDRRIESSRNTKSIRRGSSEETKWSTNTNKTSGSSERAETMADTNGNREKWNQSKNRQGSRSEQNNWWDIEPDVGRVADGVPDRTHRLKALGNAVVPQIPYYLAQSILEVMDA